MKLVLKKQLKMILYHYNKRVNRKHKYGVANINADASFFVADPLSLTVKKINDIKRMLLICQYQCYQEFSPLLK